MCVNIFIVHIPFSRFNPPIKSVHFVTRSREALARGSRAISPIYNKESDRRIECWEQSVERRKKKSHHEIDYIEERKNRT